MGYGLTLHTSIRPCETRWNKTILLRMSLDYHCYDFNVKFHFFTNDIRARFRSWDLWVMGPSRFRCCATLQMVSEPFQPYGLWAHHASGCLTLICYCKIPWRGEQKWVTMSLDNHCYDFNAKFHFFTNDIRARFRSWDLWVMGPPRFRCATLIRYHKIQHQWRGKQSISYKGVEPSP